LVDEVDAAILTSGAGPPWEEPREAAQSLLDQAASTAHKLGCSVDSG
jgi:hypothetical protein